MVVEARRRIATGRILKVEDWDVVFPGGTRATYQLVLHNGAAAVIAVDDEGRVPMVRQARPGAECAQLLEVPAGKLDDPGEDPLRCAQRELEEETGIRAARWEQLAQVYTSPGYCTERIGLFYATGLSQGARHPDPDEFIDVEWIALSDLADRAMRGEIHDMKTALSILMAERKWALGG